MKVLLIGQEGPYRGHRFLLETGEHIVGRRVRCAVSLAEDKKVSREHAVIDVGRESARLTDAGSRNGSFINQKRVIEQVLQTGDTVRFGDSVFRIEVSPSEETGDSFALPETPQSDRPIAPPEGKLEAEPQEDFSPRPSSSPESHLGPEESPAEPWCCPNCGERIPRNQTYGVCAFCACNLMPLFKGLVRIRRDATGGQQLICSHCNSSIEDYSQMACSVCHLHFVTGHRPEGAGSGEAPPEPEPVRAEERVSETPPESSSPVESEPSPRRGCGMGLLLLGVLILGSWKIFWPWLVR